MVSLKRGAINCHKRDTDNRESSGIYRAICLHIAISGAVNYHDNVSRNAWSISGFISASREKNC